jgi:hypothetical protein
MSGSRVFPLPLNRSHFAFLPGKIEVKSEDVMPFSTLFLFSQIFWYSVGLSLLYDMTESMWHWPHIMVIAFYGGMLVASAWLSHLAVKTCAGLTLLLVLVISYFSFFGQSTDLGFMNGLVSIMSGRCIDYTCWVFVMGSSILGRLTLVWTINKKKINLAVWIALASFLIGCSISILPQVTVMLAQGDNLESILASQGLNLIWLAYWGMPMRGNPKNNDGFLNQTIAKYVKLPKRYIILTMGALSYVFYDWACQYLATWLQIIWFFAPVVLYFYIQKRKMSTI